MQVSAIYQTVANAELYYRRRNACPLLGLDDLQRALDAIPSVQYDMSYADASRDYTHEKFGFQLKIAEAYDTVFMLECGALVEQMEKYPGKLFIAGGCVTDLLTKDNFRFNGDIDVFIVEESAEKAEELLTAIMKDLETPPKRVDNIHSTVQVTSCIIHDEGQQHHNPIEVQFIRRVYPSPDVILMKFDNWACQYLWSPSTGIRMTPMGAAAYIMKAFPEDCSVHSLSANHRRFKYCASKGFKVLFPGVPMGVDIQTIGPQAANIRANKARRTLFPQEQDLFSPEEIDWAAARGRNERRVPRFAPEPEVFGNVEFDDEGQQVDSDDDVPSDETLEANFGGRSPSEYTPATWADMDRMEERRRTRSRSRSPPRLPTIRDLSEAMFRAPEVRAAQSKPTQVAPLKYAIFKIDYVLEESDYSEKGVGHMNPWNLLKGNVTRIDIKLDHYTDFCSMTEKDLIGAAFGEWADPDDFRHTINMNSASKFFEKPAGYKAWAYQYYVEKDLEEARRLWYNMMERRIEVLLPLFGKGAKRSACWKVTDPGSQSFGQVNPTPMHPREFYGQCYKPTYVGIHSDVYCLIMNVFVQHRVPRDVRKMLCGYVLRAQADEAMKLLKCA